SRGGGGAGVDEIGNRFGLRDVDLAVQEGAFAEFSGTRHAAAEFEQALHQQIDDEYAAVALYLQDMFAGVGRGCREVQGDAFVDAPALRVEKAREPRLARGGQRPENADGDLRHQRTRHSNDPNTPSASG